MVDIDDGGFFRRETDNQANLTEPKCADTGRSVLRCPCRDCRQERREMREEARRADLGWTRR